MENKKIVEFIQECNHEINNPLATILGNTQLLLHSRLAKDSQSVKKLKKIESEVHKIQKITLKVANNINSFSARSPAKAKTKNGKTNR